MAAADVAQFLWKKFLRSLVDSESELSGAMNLFSYFEAIKSVLVNTQIIPFSLEMLMPWNASWEMSTYVWANAYLSELNYALAECRIFANEGREINKKILVYSPSTVYFLLKMKRRLTTLKRKFVILVSNAREQKERNNTVKRLGLLTQEKVAVKKNLEEIVVLPNASTLEIHELLVDADRVGFTPIGIVGMAGVGKSTMVQEVLTFHRVSTEFSPIVWLCLSDIIPEKELVDSASASISIVTCILDKLGEKETSISGLGLDSLLERLNDILSAKRYLIVLDDVWHTMEFYSDIGHNLPEGEKFGDRLSHGLPKDCGGAVIVTCGIREVAQDMVGQNNVFLARPWDKGWCWMHFTSFVTTKAEGFGEEKRFSMSNWEIVQKIENEILDQIGGLPSIAKALAELIVEKRISETDDKGSALKEMLIPHEFLIHRSYIFVPVNERNIKWIADKTDIPKCPVFVFVDLKMEFFAVRLLEEFRYQLNQDQVIAVLDQSFVNRQKIKTEEPEKALKEFYGKR